MPRQGICRDSCEESSGATSEAATAACVRGIAEIRPQEFLLAIESANVAALRAAAELRLDVG